MKLFQETYRGILAGLLVVAFAMAVNACQDKTPAGTPEVAIPAQTAVAPLPAPNVAAAPSGDTTAASTDVTPSAKPSTAESTAKAVKPAKAKSAGASKAETSAFAKAYRNAAAANTLLGRHAYLTSSTDKG